MTKRKIEEGTVFLVPLDGGEWAVGVVARKSPKQGMVHGIYAFFFGAFSMKPDFKSVSSRLLWEESKTILKCGALYLHKGTWPIIGKLEAWDRKDWPLVRFLKTDELSKKTYCVTYDEDDIFKVLSQVETDLLDGLIPDGLFGARAVEIYLSHTMTQKQN